MRLKKVAWMIALLGVFGTAINLTSLVIYAQYNQTPGIGHLDCRPAAFGKPAGLRWVSVYDFDHSMFYWVKSAYLGIPDQFFPKVYRTLTYKRIGPQEVRSAITSGKGARFKMEGSQGVAVPSTTTQSWGKSAPDVRILPYLLKTPKATSKYGPTPWDFDVFLSLDRGGDYFLDAFSSSDVDAIGPMSHAQAIAILREFPAALEKCEEPK